SPDSRRVAALVQEGQQLSLKVLDARGQGTPLNAVQGAPLYFCWLPDSSGLVANVGPGTEGPGPSRMLWVRLAGDGPEPSPIRERPSAGKRAAAWTQALAAATFAVERPDGSEVVAQPSADAPSEPLFSTGPGPVVIWSPAGTVAAFAAHPDREAPLYDGISLFDAE